LTSVFVRVILVLSTTKECVMAELTDMRYVGFKDWSNVAKDFAEGYAYSPEEIAKALMAIPEPEQVLFAAYGGGGYDGDAVVAYRNGDKYYLVQGSHCSCYGLEGQFTPEEYSKELFIGMLEKKLESYNTENSEYPSYDSNTWKFILDQVKDK